MRKALIAMLLCAATAASAAPAAPKLTMSDPAADSVVKAPVYMVHLMFDAPVDVATATFRVTDRAGKAIDLGQPMPMGDDGKLLMAIPNKPLAAGTYNVKWRANGPDGK